MFYKYIVWMKFCLKSGNLLLNLNIKIWPKVNKYCKGKVEMSLYKYWYEKKKLLFFKQLLNNNYILRTFCIMDWLVKFNCELL